MPDTGRPPAKYDVPWSQAIIDAPVAEQMVCKGQSWTAWVPICLDACLACVVWTTGIWDPDHHWVQLSMIWPAGNAASCTAGILRNDGLAARLPFGDWAAGTPTLSAASVGMASVSSL